ncbi:DUF6586 family protein [Marinobacter caseinilyticus]|uniref:DUF6586 family protein n=1 Tax=Marinobacter caseinilyticus TaxID=2692195 RepID=UPI00140C0D21|nr:DUF6586 family protein [Marinobacter caseinilyticus]
MNSEWPTLASQKLYLAETLLRAHEKASDRGTSEATLQGAIELALRARTHLLSTIAVMYQCSPADKYSLDDIVELIGKEAPESTMLLTLAQQPQSWWNHLDQLERAQAMPLGKQKTISEDNIIAVNVSAGPDRSVSALRDTLASAKQFVSALVERHDEW